MKKDSSFSNLWTPRRPDAIISLLEAWDCTLPRWLHHNLFEQLLIPKIRAEIESWNPKKDTTLLHVWLFPWLPVIRDKFELGGVWELVRMKMTASLADWHPSDDRALIMLTPWKQVFTQTEMESLVSRTILPKLVALLRAEFTVNPAAQDLKPLEWTLSWVNAQLLSISLAVHLFETELFPKWHKVLWTWLSSASVSFEDVSQWYSSWKSLFPPEMSELLQNQFRFGLDLMNQAMMSDGPLGSMPPLPIPLAHQEPNQVLKPRPMVPRDTMTFMDYVERSAAQAGVEFVPLVGKVHSGSGKPLYKLQGASGRALWVYVDKGVLFTQMEGAWGPVSVEDALGMT